MIKADLVKILRDKTQLPFMDCKKALMQSNGDIEEAEKILKVNGAVIREQLQDREINEGRIGLYVDSENKFASMVEVRCETAPVANTEEFRNFCYETAKEIGMKGYFKKEPVEEKKVEPNQKLDEITAKLKEHIEIEGFVVVGAGGDYRPGKITFVTGYSHHTGKISSIVFLSLTKIEENKRELLKSLGFDIAMHVVAMAPVSVNVDGVPQPVLEKEKEVYQEQVKKTMSNKPEEIQKKILNGKLEKWYKENVLLEQFFIKDDKKQVKDILKEFNAKNDMDVEIVSFSLFRM